MVAQEANEPAQAISSARPRRRGRRATLERVANEANENDGDLFVVVSVRVGSMFFSSAGALTPLDRLARPRLTVPLPGLALLAAEEDADSALRVVLERVEIAQR